MLGEASSPFCIPGSRQCIQVKVGKIDQNIQCDSRVMSIFTKRARPGIRILGEKPRYRFAYQWPYNVKIHKYTKFERNIPCGYEYFHLKRSTRENDAR